MAPSNSIPPALAPSVEEAYRRKCIQLKQRTKEVEEANKAAHLRVERVMRQIEKKRIERAFLLEQLAKRTSTNVEDSDGSPSPPPTPNDKPLRSKRGHRKPSIMANLESTPGSGPTFISQNVSAVSPSSDAYSHTNADHQPRKDARTNGVAGKSTKQPASAFELYCSEHRQALKDKAAEDDSTIDVEEELSRLWSDLSESEKAVYTEKHEDAVAKHKKELAKASNGGDTATPSRMAEPRAPAVERRQTVGTPATQDEDVEMGNYDTEGEPTPSGEKQED